jgi:signal transduction histidine kinase
MLVAFAENPGTFTHRHADLLRAFAGQAAVALGNARMHEQAQSAAVIEERQRLARELHDSVSQALYGIALGSRTARDLLSRNPESAREPMEYVLSLAETGLAEMRALIFALRPESLATEGLVAGIEKHVASTRGRHGIEVVAVLGEEPAIAVQAKEAFYRVVQEGLHNGQARGAKHDVRPADAAGVLLEVRDDGRGSTWGDFPATRLVHARGVTRLGGSFVVESAPGEGTRLVARLPR